MTSNADVGNKVKIHLKNPTSFVEGVVEGVDTYGSIILSNAKETLIPDEQEPDSKNKQQDDDELLDQQQQQNQEEEDEEEQKYKPLNSTEANPLQIIFSDRVCQVEIFPAPSSGARPVRKVFTDQLPRKRLFVSDVDTLLGRAICAKFGDSRDWEIVGTKCSTKATEDYETPLTVSSVVPSFKENAAAFKTAVLKSDVVVCPLRDDVQDAQAALRILSNTVFENEKVFILVSSVLTWSSTAAALKAKAEADAKAEKEELRKQRIENGEDPDEDEEDEEELAAANNEEDAEEEPPQVFSDSNDHERVPHPRYQHWRLLEQATKFANSESLHTYVLMPGLLYGDGEEALKELFMAAWHREQLPICYPLGKNVIPTIHVRDLSTAIFNASNAEEVQPTRYMIATDSGNNSWSEIVTTLAKTMGDPNDEVATIDKPLGGANRWYDYFSLDLRLEASNLGALIQDDEWIAQGGLVENMERIAKEFRTKQELTPIRMAVVGPPASGKSSLAQWISKHYGLEYINVPEIIRYYTQHRQDVFKKLVAHREMKKAEAERQAALEAAEEGGDEFDMTGGGGESGRGSVLSGDSMTSSARREAGGGKKKAGGTGNAAGLVDYSVLAEGDEDLEDFADESGDDFDVKFTVKDAARGGGDRDAPSRMSQGGDSNYGTEDGEDGADSQFNSSRRGGGDEDFEGEDDGEDEDGKPKAPVPPEVEAAEDKEEDDDEDEALLQLKEQLRLCNKVLSLKTPEGRFIDHALAVMARYKIVHSAQGKNQGYVLDGFPKTTRQAAFTFSHQETFDVSQSLPEFDEETGLLPEEALNPIDPEDEGEISQMMEAVDGDMMLDYAIVLDASDEVIVSRASSHGSGNTEDPLARIYRRLEFNQKYNSRGGKPGLSVQSWLRAILTNADNTPSRSVAVMELNTDDYWPITGDAAVNQVKHFLGAPHMIHPTVQELQDAAREAERLAQQEQKERQAAEVERKQQTEERETKREAVNTSHTRRLLTSSDEKQAANAVCSIPAQSYLTDQIAAPLATCVAEVSRVRPQDPLTVLADKLYQYEAPIVRAKEILTGKKSPSSSNNGGVTREIK